VAFVADIDSPMVAVADADIMSVPVLASVAISRRVKSLVIVSSSYRGSPGAERTRAFLSLGF
jgi:hypothetical protein